MALRKGFCCETRVQAEGVLQWWCLPVVCEAQGVTSSTPHRVCYTRIEQPSSHADRVASPMPGFSRDIRGLNPGPQRACAVSGLS